MKQKIGNSHVDKPDPDPAKIWCNILKLYESCVLVVVGGGVPAPVLLSYLPYFLSQFLCARPILAPLPAPALAPHHMSEHRLILLLRCAAGLRSHYNARRT